MKRQRLVSSFTPALQKWLEEELENRGVDSVYARSILSLLQQDYVDVEPHEYQNPRNHQHRVLYKYGGAENLSYASKSKHQKWKTWGKHILTSASPCRKAAYYDLERLLKKAAVDCLKSASDYAYDIEELIDEVWIKLKSKSLKGEQEEIALRNRNPLGHSFFIPPSPTDEIEKYFAAFPPLSSKNECAVETAKHKILKNVWCKNCNLKRKSNVQDEEALNAENQKFHSNKSVQPIIPYRSLKTIKNIFKNSGFKSPWKASYAQHGTVSKRAVIYGVKSFKLPAIIEDSLLSFSNLTSANIHEISLNKIELLTLLKDVGVKNVLLFCNEPGISKETSVAKSSFIRSNEPSLCALEDESSDLILFPKAMNPEDNSKKYAAGHITSSGSFSEENSLNDAKGLSDYHGIDIHFRMSPLADLLEYKSPCLEPSDDGSAAVPESIHSVETLKYCLSELSNSFNINNSELYTQPDAVINCLESENSIVRRGNALTCHKFDSYFVGESQVHSQNSSRALDIQSDLYSQNANFSIKQSFNPLDIINTSHVETSLFFSDTESDKHVEIIESSNFESCCSDDEIYYSDDDSNEIFRSENKENSNFSDISFQHTEQNCVLNKFSEDTMAETEIEGASVSEPNQYNLIFSVDSEERSVLNNNEFKHDETEQKLLKVLNLASDNLNFINVKSTCKKLPFISYSQSESVDKNYVTERNANYEYFPNIFDERRSGLPVQNYSLAESNVSDKVVASSASKCTAGAEQKSSEIEDKKWLFYWGDNHNFIARTWQKDFVPAEEKESKEQLLYDVKIGESQVHSLNSGRALDIQSDLYSQNANLTIKQSFNPLDIINTSHVETSLFFSDTESDKHVETISSSSFESCCSDDEIYYSDDDSNEIFRSENKENSRFSEDTLAETEIEGASVSEPNQYNLIFSVDSEERSVLDNNEFKHDETEQKLLKVLNLSSDNLNFINVKSTCKKLPFISYSQSESVDKNCVTERNANYEYFPNIFDERRSGLPVQNYSLAESNVSDKVVASSASKCTAGAEQKSSEIEDKKWLFYWGDNHNFIARTWQKDFVPAEEKESKEQLLYDVKIGESQVHSLNSGRALDIQSDLYSQNANLTIKQSFNPLDIINTSHVETSLFFSDTESDKHVETISSSSFESCCSDDEIYYSDDDSNEIFRSENKENSRFSEDTLAETEIEGASVSEPNQYNLIFSVDSEERSVLDNNEFKHDETEQKLLKVLNLSSDNLNFINVKSTCKKLPFISYSQSESVDKNCVTERNANYEYFPNIFDERKSGLPVQNYSLAESNVSDKVVASSASKCTAGAGQKSSEIEDKKWLFYWGDNHNFIARTWQKDFVPAEEKESKEQLFYDAKISTALCKEIKEEEDELLKGLCSVPPIGNTVFVNELCKLKQNDLHSSHLPSQIENLSNGCEEKTSLYVQVPESHKIAVNQVENYIPIMNNSFTFDNIENNVPVMQCTGDYSVSFENNPFKAANFPDLSAFSNASEENGSFKDYYMEGGGWSLASDSVADYYCDNPYERSCSMSDLDLEKSNNDYLEFFYQKRQRCTSETDDVEMTGYNDAPNPYKKSKQKLAPKKKPCCFFLQGTCTRSDCRYSHDLSTITCRFWSEGSCFKGPTCPFLHDYLPENDERPLQDDAYLRSQSPDLSYSLESEADFPSLSSSKSEEPRVKSEAINIPFVKGSKKKRKEK